MEMRCLNGGYMDKLEKYKTLLAFMRSQEDGYDLEEVILLSLIRDLEESQDIREDV